MIHINDEFDEGLFFECWYDEKSNVKKPHAKINLVIQNKMLLEKETQIFQAIKAGL